MGRGLYWKLALRNLVKNRRVYAPYLLSSIGIIMMFYIMSAMTPSIARDEMYGGESVATVMKLGTFVIGLFAVLFLFYTNSFIMKRRKKELGLYNILGLEKRHIAKITLRETLLTAAFAIGLGLAFGILFSKTMFLVLGKILSVDIPIAFTVPASAILTTVFMFLAVFALTMLYNLFQVWKSKPIELLHGSDTGEREPKARWVLTVLGLAALGTGYAIALTIQDPVDALTWFFGAVVLVIIGTYFLFISGTIALLKVLKKNKRFYYQPRHFTTVSGMLYRMKQNAAGLASICILFTCLLVTVSSTFALYTGMEGMLRERYPRNVMVHARDANDTARDMIRAIAAEECEKMGLTPENIYDWKMISYTVARRGSEFSFADRAGAEVAVVQMSLLEDFNRNTGRNVVLREDEVLLGDPSGTLSGVGTITFDYTAAWMEQQELRVISADYEFVDGYAHAVIYNTYYLVFRDETALAHVVYPAWEEAGEEWHSPLTASYGFDVDTDYDGIKTLFGNLMDRFTTDFPAEGASFQGLSIEDVGSSYQGFLALYGGIFFVGLFLGTLFLLGTALIIYYKQVSEGYEDARRFDIMQKVGMSRAEVKKSIHSQVLTVFFLPLVTAVVHLCFAFPMLHKILILMNLADTGLMLLSCAACVALFSAVYAVIYLLTARTYYKTVETAAA